MVDQRSSSSGIAVLKTLSRIAARVRASSSSSMAVCGMLWSGGGSGGACGLD
jgi:hypothetical protein